MMNATGRAAGILVALLFVPLPASSAGVAPTVVSTEPASAATNVVLGAGIRITFSATMDQTSSEAAFSIVPAVAGSFFWSGAAVTFQPSSDLAASTLYQVAIAGTAQDSLGTPMGSAHNFSFTTGTISGIPLPAGWIKTVLRLGAQQTDAIVSIPRPNEMEGIWDFFQLGGLGLEHLQQPAPGRAAPLANVTTTQTPMVWTAITDGNND